MEKRAMLVLDKVVLQTDDIFGDSTKIVVPDPSVHWLRKIEVLEEAKLYRQRAAAIHDMRCEQADNLGFQQMTEADAVAMLMQEEHTHEENAEKRQDYEYCYNHHTDTTMDNTWGNVPHHYIRSERSGIWLAMREKWRVQVGKMDFLKRKIPYGVVLQIQEAKKLKLFNAFSAVAPMDAWLSETDLDPIILAEIWTLPPAKEAKEAKEATAGRETYFFLAQWE